MALLTSKGAGMVYPHEVDENGVVVSKNVNVDNQAGEPDEAVAVTGRTADEAPANTTFADRKSMAGRRVEDKMVGGLDAMTKDELLDEADRRGVEVSASWKKAEIIEAIRG